MPNDLLTDDQVGLSGLSDSDVGLGQVPSVTLSPYQQLQMRGQSLAGLGATTGPAHREEVQPLLQAANTPARILKYALEQGTGAASDLMSDFLRRTGIDPSSQPGQPIISAEKFSGVTAIPGTNIRPLELLSPDIEQGVRSGVSEALSGFTEPGQAAMLPFAGTKPVQAAFGVQALSQIPEDIQNIAQAEDLRSGTTATTKALINAAMAAGIGKHLLGEEPYAISQRSAETLPLAETPRDSQAVEQGIRDTEKPSDAQKEEVQAQAEVESPVPPTSAPEAVSPTVSPPTPEAPILPPLPAELQRAVDKQREAVAKGATGPYPEVEADAKQWQENQGAFAEGAKKGQPDLDLWKSNEALKNKYKSEQAGVTKPQATTADVLGKVSERLDAAAEAAKARLKSQQGGTTFGSGPLHELPNIRDYAIIGAAKIAKGATEFARWSAEMIKDFGEAIKPHLENIFARAQEAFDDHANVVTRVNRILYEAGLPRRSVAEAGKRAVGKAIESGVGAGKALSEAESAPKLAEVQKQLSESIPNAVALREYFKGQEKGGKAGRKAATEELKLADKWLEADAQRIRDSLISFAKSSLPVSERGRFLKAITDATGRPALVGGDPEIMYRKAAQVAARIEDRATEVRKANLATEIKDSVTKAISSPSVDIGYKNKILDAVKRIAFKKPTAETINTLKATRDFLSRQEAQGADVTIPKEVIDDLEVLGKVPARELPEHVLEAIRDKVNLLDQLGRLKVKARQQIWDIEKNGKLRELAGEKTNPVQERPQFKPQPGDPRPLSMRIRNWANRQMNMAALIDKALLPIDALFDLIGDAKGTYKGWLFKNVRNPLDLNFNEYSVLRDSKTAALEKIIKEYNLGEKEAERIGVYATALQEGGIDRMVKMGVKPETISNILANITPAEMKAYQAMRQAMDSTLPEIQRLMHELYNIEVKPVPDYFPMPRDWSLYEGEPVAKEPTFGKPMDFDELAGWKQMLGDFTQPKTSKTERGFTIERKPEAGTPIKLNAFDVFYQHMNDVAYLLKTQRNLKMMGEMARGDLFKQKYGNVGQAIVTGWLDTVARQGRLGGLRRIPFLDELRKRTSVGVIGFRLASQFVHLSNIPLSVWRTGGPLWYKAGLGESLTEHGQKFIKDNFSETQARGGGEPALVEASQSGVSVFGKTVVPKSIVRASFAIARKIDQMNAQATTLGAYLRLLSEKGIDPRTYDKIPVDKEAQAQALVLSRRAVASPLPKDVSPSLSRGAITGGNVSLARTIFQFQNIFQDQWSNIRHDLYKAGLREKNPKLAATAFIALTAMILSEMGIREASKEAIQSATGSKPKKEQSNEEKMALELVRRVPFGGQLTSQIMYGQSGIPSLDSITQVSKASKQAATAKKEATQTKALIRAVSGAAQLGGVPGASQIGELIEKSQ